MNKYLTLTVLVCGLAANAAHAADGPAKGKGAAKATPVIVQEAAMVPLVDKVEAIGTLRANETITLASTVTETVTAVNFEDNQRVKKGDILVEMARGEEKALIDQQRALVREASQQLDRARELVRAGATSQTILDQRQREYTAAVSGMAALQARLDDYLIAAPFDGVVGLRNTSIGALLQPGTRITTLDDDSTMKLDFSVPSVFLPTIKTGLAIVAHAPGFKQTFNGTITAIDSQINADTRAVTVRATLPNPDAALKPGLLMTVALLKDPRDGVVVDENAIIPEGRQAFVFVVDPKSPTPKVEKREVTIGTRRPGDVEITDHLKPGEFVIVKGTMVAIPGQPVSITSTEKSAEGAPLPDVQPAAASDSNKDPSVPVQAQGQ